MRTLTWFLLAVLLGGVIAVFAASEQARAQQVNLVDTRPALPEEKTEAPTQVVIALDAADAKTCEKATDCVLVSQAVMQDIMKRLAHAKDCGTPGKKRL